MRWSSYLVLVVVLFVTQANIEARRFKIPPRSESFLKYGMAQSGEGLNPREIKVVVWNILKSKKRRAVSEFASFGRDTDVFLLQEVATVEDFFKSYLHYPEHEIHFGASFYQRKRGKKIKSGTAISTRVTPEASGMIRSTALEPFVKTPKVVTWMKIPLTGQNQSILFVNIHGLNLTKNRDFFVQMDDCNELIKAHDGPVVFGGDFNTSDMEKYNKMTEVALENNLVPVAFLNDKRKKSRFSRLVIDHVFVRGLTVKTANVHNELKSSDHKAMSLTLRLP